MTFHRLRSLLPVAPPIFALPLFALATLGFAAPAAAQDVAVAPFTGPRATAARRAVVEVVREAGPLSYVSADDHPDMVVSARLRGRGRSAQVRLTVEDADGHRLASRTVRMRSRRSFQRGVEATLRRSVAAYRRQSQRDSRREERRERRASRDDDDDQDEAPARRNRATPGEGMQRPIVEVLAGVRLAGRLANFEMTDGNRHRNDVAYPELNLDVGVRPWRDEEGIERGLVFRGFFGHAVGLRSINTLTGEPVGTTFFRGYGEVGMLFEPDPNVELGLGIGFGWDAFAFEPQALVVLPSAEYAYLRPNLRGRFRIERELAVLDLVAGYRGVLARGELSQHFGEEGQTQGFDVMARFGGSLDLGFAYAVEAGVTSYFHFFSGDASTTPAREGTDVGLWLGASVGFAIR
ncbi:MAG: hypothetical protein AB8I08_12605 [Sandaracinaceae bacterium]